MRYNLFSGYAQKASTIKYSNRKGGTLARAFSKTFAHGKSKNEISKTKSKKKKVRKERKKVTTSRVVTSRSSG